MPLGIPCPDPAEYQKLASGELVSPQKDSVLEHLEHCDACITRVQGVSEKDALVELIRQAGKLGQEDEAVGALIERFLKLRPAGDLARQTAEVRNGGCATYDFLAPPQAPDEMGRVGPYRVLEVLGEGGMGVVFRAEDPQLRRPVAVKVMLPKMAAVHAGHKRFLREARAMAAIKHDHIVSIYQVGEDRGIPYLAMEYLEGETLEDRLRRETKLSVSEVLRLGRQIASGLAAAHERGLIHRDIKPSNLWLEDQGQAGSVTHPRLKILDFGLASVLEEGSALTRQDMLVGTPEYMAPEQVEGEGLDHRCDLFSLGCVLYRMVTGVWPFKRANWMSTLMAVTSKDPVSPSELEPAIPAALSELIVRLLAKKPGKRPQSARDVADALERIEKQELSRGVSRRSGRWLTALGSRARKWPAILKMRGRLVGAGVVACVLLIALSYALRMAIPNEGVLVLDVNQPDATVSVDGDVVTVTWDKGGKRAEMRVKPGPHMVEVTKNGFRVQAKELTFKALDIEVFSARLEPVPGSSQEKAQPDSLPHR
jgi:serine/threonine protein kinase